MLRAQPAETGPSEEPTPAEEPTSAEEPTEEPTREPAEPAGSSRTTDITAGPGGVMTDEVGVITGDLTVRSDLEDGKLTVHVQYKEADEWYVLTGGKATLKDPADLEAVHTVVCAVLHRPEG